MDFQAGADRLSGPGLAAGLARAAQDGEHLKVAFDGGELYLAFTTLDDLAGHDVLV